MQKCARTWVAGLCWLLASACSEDEPKREGSDAAVVAPTPGADAGLGVLPGAEAAVPLAPADAALPGMDGAAPTPVTPDAGVLQPGAEAGPPAPDAAAGAARPPPTCASDAGAGDAGVCGACTHQGSVEGALSGSTCQFLGVPYAKPPVGPLRFMAPEPAPAWSGVKRVAAFGAACVQSLDLSGTDQKSEDCLFLNVWSPSVKPSAPLPVMVFIYGGGFSGGATNTYSGLGLATKGPAVVVSMNYRVGALGFFAHAALDQQRAGKPSGSDGIRDQQLALQWVRDNIASFHGDPGNVTVFGESAGASSVCVHLVSPGSRGLARRFIMESGVCTDGVSNGIEAMARDKAYAVSGQMVSALCASAADPITCLRGLPADQIIGWAPSAETQMNLSWTPVIEGEGGVLPEHPDALIARGAFNRGEVLIGTNKNEAGLFNPIPLVSASALRSSVSEQFGAANTDAILALYPEAASDPYQAQVSLMTDVMFRCAARKLARALSAAGQAVYLYSFEQDAAWHADEMGYVFGDGNYALALTTIVPALQDAMQSYWTNFARGGDPNGGTQPLWPKYTQASDGHMRLVDPPVAGTGLSRAACDYWDSYRAP
jgi:para-nitrobenzyl esterase